MCSKLAYWQDEKPRRHRSYAFTLAIPTPEHKLLIIAIEDCRQHFLHQWVQSILIKAVVLWCRIWQRQTYFGLVVSGPYLDQEDIGLNNRDAQIRVSH